MDARRWEGRSIAACLKRWAKVKLECGRFRNAMEKVRGFSFASGEPSELDLERCATFVFNGGMCSQAVVDAVLTNPNYPVGKPFIFLEAFRYLVNYTGLLERPTELLGDRRQSNTKFDPDSEFDNENDAMDDDADHVNDHNDMNGDNRVTPTVNLLKPTRPRKLEALTPPSASREGKESPLNEPSMPSLDDPLQDSGMRVPSFVRNLDKPTETELNGMSAEVAKQEVLLKERRFQWEMAKELFGPASDAPEEEKTEVRLLLRKSLLKTLRAQVGNADDFCDDDDDSSQVRKRMKWDSPDRNEQSVVGATAPNGHE